VDANIIVNNWWCWTQRPRLRKREFWRILSTAVRQKNEKKGKNGPLDTYLINGPPMSVVLLTKCPEPFAGVGYNWMNCLVIKNWQDVW
jgi:hypothetical protein